MPCQNHPKRVTGYQTASVSQSSSRVGFDLRQAQRTLLTGDTSIVVLLCCWQLAQLVFPSHSLLFFHHLVVSICCILRERHRGCCWFVRNPWNSSGILRQTNARHVLVLELLDLHCSEVRRCRESQETGVLACSRHNVSLVKGPVLRITQRPPVAELDEARVVVVGAQEPKVRLAYLKVRQLEGRSEIMVRGGTHRKVLAVVF